MKKSNTLKFMMNMFYAFNLHFAPSTCIHRSIILMFIEEKYAFRFFCPWKIFFPQFSIFISTRILISMTNSRLCCLMSQQQSVSQGLYAICVDNCTTATLIEVADLACYLTQSQYPDTGPTSLSTAPIIPGVWKSCCCSCDL